MRAGVVLAGVTAAGCGEETEVLPIAQERVVAALVEPQLAMGALALAAGSNPAPETAVALADDVTLDARLLVLTAGGAPAALAAITTTLDYLGTPYDVFDASAGAMMTADFLVAGDHGRYYGILLDTGDLAVGSASAFSDAEWMALASYEARFGVRRAVLYAVPTAAYGLQSTGGFDAKPRPIAARCTAAGSTVFVGANCAVPVNIDDGWAYGSQPTDASTHPLLVDAAGSVYAATRAYADGREALVLTFSQSPTALHTLGLAYGVVSWVTRGLFVGERHVYVSPQLDDFFLPSAIYPEAAGITYRCTAADLQAFASWQRALRADPVTAQFRAAFAFNAYGARPAGEDALTDKARELGPTFAWINHTWDHKDLTSMAYAAAFEEFSKNNYYGVGGLSPYSVENLVTPGISGLDNAAVMRAAYDVGIRQLVSDTTKPGQNNPSPNAGYYNAHVPALLTIPRRATDLYFNVSQPSEWVAEYGALRSGTFSYEQIIADESDSLVRSMLRGENDPWMFHQANIRDIGGGESLFTALMGAVLAKYKSRATFPMVSPTMEELAGRVKARMALNASGVRATLEPGGKLTVRVAKAATVPVTGLCTPGAEAYAGQKISYLKLAAGQSVTLSLADCSDGIVGMGGGGTGGAGGGDSGPSGSGTQGHLSTDGGINQPRPDGGGCAVSGEGRGGAGALLIAFIFAVAASRRLTHPPLR
jgi:hypothetical protein